MSGASLSANHVLEIPMGVATFGVEHVLPLPHMVISAQVFASRE
jgi:hypothetical protein